MTREEGTGLWYFFIMLVLASAADRWVLQLLVKPSAGLGVSGEWQKSCYCLDFRIMLEQHSKFFFICLKFHIHNSVCPCNKWKSVPAKPFPLALICVQFLQKSESVKSHSISLITCPVYHKYDPDTAIGQRYLQLVKVQGHEDGARLPLRPTPINPTFTVLGRDCVHRSLLAETTSSSAGPHFSLFNTFFRNKSKLISRRILSSL